MDKVLVIADDLTGALDTGVQFSQEGISTIVIMDTIDSLEIYYNTYDVVVIDSETRHISPKDAYRIIFDIVRVAKALQVSCIYKKTDSTLRGNLGSELTALLDASEESALPFIPAYPKNGRITRGGVQYLDGIPLAQSVAGRDPYNPVVHSFIPDILLANGSAEICLVPFGAEIPDFDGILLFDAETEDQIFAVGHRLSKRSKLRVIAGCAGFASLLPSLLCLQHRSVPSLQRQKGVLIVSGSANPVSIDQVNAINEGQIFLHTLTIDQKVQRDYWNTTQGQKDLVTLTYHMLNYSCLIIRALDKKDNLCDIRDIPDSDMRSEEDLRKRICENIGELVKQLVLLQKIGNLIVIGGDTFAGILKAFSIQLLIPVCEIAPGVAVSILAIDTGTINIVSKSGSFGTDEVLLKVLSYLAENPDQSSTI